jgi:hypothetical protein
MAPEVKTSWGDVVQGFVVPVVVIVTHEPCDFLGQFPGEVIVLKLDDIFHGPVIPFDLSLGHRVIGCLSGMSHALLFQINFQLPRKVARAIIT